MKILWVKTDFLHPTTRGGQIRTLEMVKRLHARHELHYLTLRRRAGMPKDAAAPASTHLEQYIVPHTVPSKRSLVFAGQVAAGLFRALPLAISRYESAAMRSMIIGADSDRALR